MSDDSFNASPGVKDLPQSPSLQPVVVTINYDNPDADNYLWFINEKNLS